MYSGTWKSVHMWNEGKSCMGRRAFRKSNKSMQPGLKHHGTHYVEVLFLEVLFLVSLYITYLMYIIFYIYTYNYVHIYTYTHIYIYIISYILYLIFLSLTWWLLLVKSSWSLDPRHLAIAIAVQIVKGLDEGVWLCLAESKRVIDGLWWPRRIGNTLNQKNLSQFEDQTYTLAISGSFAVPSIIHGWQRYGERFLVHPINPIAYHWVCPTCVDPLIIEAGFPWVVFIDGEKGWIILINRGCITPGWTGLVETCFQ